MIVDLSIFFVKVQYFENKPENPFQNYDVANETLKTNQNFGYKTL